ncbi:MAG: hypothetical protein M3R03_09785 [Pseudomonadota bacterium]|nr:hypothetical protein [Pseudomonadota bacterium]
MAGHAPNALKVGLVLVGVGVIIAVDGLTRGIVPAEPPPTSTPRASEHGPANAYDATLALLDQRLADAKTRVKERPGEWLVLEALARHYLSRAKLTGSFEDYAHAQSALQQAFAVAGPHVGPHATQALLDFSVHRLGAAGRALDQIDGYAVPPAGEERAELIAMRGDLDFYSGNYARAYRHYARADQLSPGSSDFRLAIYQSRMGEFALADKHLQQILLRHPIASARSRAFVEMHRGILNLEVGRLDAALSHFKKANAIFPGFWLIEEHLAEVATLKGEFGQAEQLYASVVQRTGHPEFMDALAAIAAQRGNQALARHWRSRAAQEWQRRLRLFPEAAFGHALDHCLDTRDRACALNLARRNHSARPFGESKLKLAEALNLNGQSDEAASLIAEVQRSGWRSTP